jgi:hypothetical protein
MNPTAESLVARVGIAGAGELVDAIGEGRVVRSAGAFEIELPPRTARLFACAN